MKIRTAKLSRFLAIAKSASDVEAISETDVIEFWTPLFERIKDPATGIVESEDDVEDLESLELYLDKAALKDFCLHIIPDEISELRESRGIESDLEELKDELILRGRYMPLASSEPFFLYVVKAADYYLEGYTF